MKDIKSKINMGISVGLVLLMISMVGYSSVTRTITDTGDTIDTYIRNSKGNYWSATIINLQIAIWDLNSTNGGWVEIPTMLVFTASSQRIRTINNLELRGRGWMTGLKIGNGVNMSGAMIRNPDWVNNAATTFGTLDYNLTIHDMTLNGNAWLTPRYVSTAWWSSINHGIALRYMRQVNIYNCNFVNISGDGVDAVMCSDIHVDNNRMYGIGANQSTTTEMTTRGAYFYYCNNMTFIGNKVYYTHCSGVAIEPGECSIAYASRKNVISNRDFIISNNLIDNCFNGIWIEGWNETYDELNTIKYGTISNNIIRNVTYPYGYTVQQQILSGITVTRYTKFITIIGNVIEKVGITSRIALQPGYSATGLWLNGKNLTVIGNTVRYVYGNGTSIRGNNITFEGNIISSVFGTSTEMGYGVLLLYDSSSTYPRSGCSNLIDGNIISYCYTYGIYCQRNNNTITNNKIDGQGTGIAGSCGIRMGGGGSAAKNATDCIVIGNLIKKFATGIYEYPTIGGAAYCIYIGNNCRFCTTPINLIDASDPYNNNDVVSANIGTIS